MERISGHISPERLKEALDYNPETGVFIWRAHGKRGVRIGRAAGSVDQNGYRYIRVDGEFYLAHRLAWLYAHGSLPSENLVGFTDGDKTNLRIANLHLVSANGRPKGEFDFATPEGKSSAAKKRRNEFPNLYRDKELQKTFGITLADYQSMFVDQKGVCAICEQPETAKRGSKTKWLAVDHCHETGKVRGLLCSSCNVMIGFAQDSVERLTSAIAYIQRHAEKKSAPDNVVPMTRKGDTHG